MEKFEPKKSIYIKDISKFIKWDNYSISIPSSSYIKNISLNKYIYIAPPFLDYLKEYITLCKNSSGLSVYQAFYTFRIFDKYLSLKNVLIDNPNKLNSELIISFVYTLRDNCQILGLKNTNTLQGYFSTFRRFFRWVEMNGFPEFKIDCLDSLNDISFKTYENTGLKQMDLRKGPFTQVELLILDKFFLEKRLNWKTLKMWEKLSVIFYWINRETSRKSNAFCSLKVSDFIHDGKFCWVRMPDRKPLNSSKLSQMPMKISQALYDLIIEYKNESNTIRKNLKTDLFCVYHMDGGACPKKRERNLLPVLLSFYISNMVEKGNLPNRNYFLTNKKLDLKDPKNRRYRLHYSINRGRDTYGTHMAIMGVPFELLSVRMGHRNYATTLKYYIILNPENIENLLSNHLGVKYKKFRDYFFKNPEKKYPLSNPIRVLDEPDSLDFGNCELSYCNSDPRIACYRCHKFTPIFSEEHEKNLLWLKSKKAKLIEEIKLVGGDPSEIQQRMYLRQIDLSIAGVEHVISKNSKEK